MRSLNESVGESGQHPSWHVPHHRWMRRLTVAPSPLYPSPLPSVDCLFFGQGLGAFALCPPLRVRYRFGVSLAPPPGERSGITYYAQPPRRVPGCQPVDVESGCAAYDSFTYGKMFHQLGEIVCCFRIPSVTYAPYGKHPRTLTKVCQLVDFWSYLLTIDVFIELSLSNRMVPFVAKSLRRVFTINIRIGENSRPSSRLEVSD